MKADLDAAGRPLVDLAPAVKQPTFAQFTPEEQDFYLAFEKETQVGAALPALPALSERRRQPLSERCQRAPVAPAGPWRSPRRSCFVCADCLCCSGGRPPLTLSRRRAARARAQTHAFAAAPRVKWQPALSAAWLRDSVAARDAAPVCWGLQTKFNKYVKKGWTANITNILVRLPGAPSGPLRFVACRRGAAAGTQRALECVLGSGLGLGPNPTPAPRQALLVRLRQVCIHPFTANLPTLGAPEPDGDGAAAPAAAGPPCPRPHAAGAWRRLAAPAAAAHAPPWSSGAEPAMSPALVSAA